MTQSSRSTASNSELLGSLRHSAAMSIYPTSTYINCVRNDARKMAWDAVTLVSCRDEAQFSALFGATVPSPEGGSID